jgi:hypothetical protein
MIYMTKISLIVLGNSHSTILANEMDCEWKKKSIKQHFILWLVILYCCLWLPYDYFDEWYVGMVNIFYYFKIIFI